MTTGTWSDPPPDHIDLPPVPPLISSEDSAALRGASSSSGLDGDMTVNHDSERTNTLALLLPHLALFEPPIQALLKDHYAQYGDIAHWAPVKGFGRVIIVYTSEDDAMLAKLKGDRLKLDVELPDLPEPISEERRSERDQRQPASQAQSSGGPSTAHEGDTGTATAGQDPSYFATRHRRRKSYQARKGITLRLHPLPPTPLNVLASEQHLKPPDHARNFLISPPGSPPEGWEPIVEDGPNTSTLAEDLQRALEHLQLNWAAVEGGRGHGRRGSLGKMVVHDDGGVRVEVEDCTGRTDEAGAEGADEDDEMPRVARSRSGSLEHDEQYQYDGTAFGLTSQGLVPVQVPSNATGGMVGGLSSAMKVRIAPTARPPVL